MVSIENKKDCCGCTACEQVCPRKCISLTVDNEGFSYPEVDKDHCMNCGLCDSVCPIKANKEPRMPLHVYAAKSCDMNIQKASSSGGVFYHIASYVLGKGGVVFGARFDENWRVIHDYTDSLEGLRLFMTSKYVQSEIGVSYKVAKDFLRIGRIVFFTGTPCQIAGLHSYLRH